MNVLLIGPTALDYYGRPIKQRKLHLPGLTLPMLAAVTPGNVNLRLLSESVEEIPFDEQWDLVVITGGSSGIGFAVAKELVVQHARLVLIARNKERLNEAKEILDEKGNSGILLLSADVTNKEQIFAAIQQAGEHFGRIDIVINCAGIITCGHFSDQSIDELEACLSVNYAGALYTAKAAWPWLKKSKGQLSFVSSVAGYIGLIGYSSYAPTKFAIAGLAECLRMEGKNDGIAVSIVYPPDTNTPLLEYERAHALPETIALSGTIKAMSAEKVASIYLRGIAAHKFAIHCNANSRFLQWLKSNFPSLFYAIMDKICRRAAAAERMESKIKATIGNAG